MPRILMLLIAVPAVIYIVGRYEHHLLAMLGAPVMVLRIPILALRRLIQMGRHGLASATRALFERFAPLTDDQVRRKVWYGAPMVGAVLFAIAAVFFAYVDQEWFRLTFAGMGLGFSQAAGRTVALDQLSGISIVALATFWGIMLLDVIGITHLSPFAGLDERGRRGLKSLSLIMVVGCLLVVAMLGLWRALQLDHMLTAPPAQLRLTHSNPIVFGQGVAPLQAAAPVSAAPAVVSLPLVDERIERLIPVGVNILLPVLLFVSALLAGWGATATVTLALGLILASLTLLLGVLQLITKVLLSLLDVVWGFCGFIVKLAGSICRRLWNWVATVDPMSDQRLIGPIEADELPEAFRRLHQESLQRISFLSETHQNRSYDQAIRQKESHDDEQDDDQTRLAA